MGKALLRFGLDALYVLIFASITTASTIGLKRLVGWVKAEQVHGSIVWLLERLEIVLAAIDVMGVALAALWLMWRFLVILVKAEH